MSATFSWCSDNGALVSSHGTTRSGFGADTHYATDCSWKNADDCYANGGTLYSAAPIVSGSNSYSIYQYGKFSGTYNEILNCKWSARTAPSGALATGLTLKGTVTETYATPATTTNAALTTDYTSAPVAVASGLAVTLGADPSSAAAATLSSGGGYTAYLVSQLQTSSSAAPGDITTITSSLVYDEN